MLSPQDHGARIAGIRAQLDETARRLTARLEAAQAQHPPAGVWNAAQIGAHVALVNDNLAAAIDGTSAGATPPAADFVERAWSDIASGVPPRNQAPARFVPPDDVTLPDGLDQLRRSVEHLHGALTGLSPERASYCITNRAVGTISLYQAGEFAIAHMIRHNQQAKRLLAAHGISSTSRG